MGQLELRQYGGDLAKVNLNLYPVPPNITNVKVFKGDRQAIIIGERLEQIQAIRINGKRALAKNPDSATSQPVAATQSNNMNPSPAINEEKVFVFENSGQWQDSNRFSLELELDGQRMIESSSSFGVSASRPVFAANQAREIEGFIVDKSADVLKDLPIFSMETDKIGVNIENALTDYNLKIENLTVETRIENTESNPFQENHISFEVFDWHSMRLNIQLTEQAKKMLGGRRIQFRIRDSKRGDSDWYSIKQTFVRMPQISSFSCPPQSDKECQLSGKGISYIQQISTDNGTTWFPQEPTGLVSKPGLNGLETVLIPNTGGKSKALKIKLRDFPNPDGLPISSFMLVNR